jgi:predicted dehydrogenase
MPADRIVKFGILSSANIGLNTVIPAMMKSQHARPVALSSRNQETADEAAKKADIPRAYGSYDGILTDPEVEAVYIPTANDLHAEWAIRAAEAGKHVLCEKPLAMNLEEALKMREACKKAGVLLMDAFMYRHHPQHARAKEILKSGDIGEVKLVRASFTFALNAKPEENIRLRPETGGGALMDVGCYCVNASRYMMEAEPVRVTAFGDYSEGLGVDTQFYGVLDFGGDRAAIFDTSFRHTFQNYYQVVGTQGIVTVLTSFVPGDGDTKIRVQKGSEIREETVAGTNQYTLEVDHFARAVLDGTLLPAPAEDGVANMAVVDALHRSAREGRAVEVEKV